MAGAFLSFGGLLDEVISGGSPALNASNPGLVKVLGGFVFPVGLVMCVPQSQVIDSLPTLTSAQDCVTRSGAAHKQHDDHAHVRLEACHTPLGAAIQLACWCVQRSPRARVFRVAHHRIVFFGNLVGSLFFGAILVKCMSHFYPQPPSQSCVFPDSGVVSAAPYVTFIRDAAV